MSLLLTSCGRETIDGIVIKNFDNKKEYYQEGRYHAFGLEKRKKNFNVAGYYLKKALRFDPNDFATIDLLASLYRENRNPDVEEKLYLYCLKKTPDNLKLLYALGKFYLLQNKFRFGKNIPSADNFIHSDKFIIFRKNTYYFFLFYTSVFLIG